MMKVIKAETLEPSKVGEVITLRSWNDTLVCRVLSCKRREDGWYECELEVLERKPTPPEMATKITQFLQRLLSAAGRRKGA